LYSAEKVGLYLEKRTSPAKKQLGKSHHCKRAFLIAAKKSKTLPIYEFDKILKGFQHWIKANKKR